MNDLAKILEEIDKIEDDIQRRDAERDIFIDYCRERNFILSDDVMAMIKERGLYDSYEVWLEMHYEATQWE